MQPNQQDQNMSDQCAVNPEFLRGLDQAERRIVGEKRHDIIKHGLFSWILHDFAHILPSNMRKFHGLCLETS